MNQLKTAFLLVALTVLLVLVGRLLFGDAGTVTFLLLAVAMNGVAYWFSDRIALASAQAQEVSPADRKRGPVGNDVRRLRRPR